MRARASLAVLLALAAPLPAAAREHHRGRHASRPHPEKPAATAGPEGARERVPNRASEGVSENTPEGAPKSAPDSAEDRALAAARVAAAARLQAVEAAADRAATRLDSLSRRRAALEGQLAARAAAVAPLLPLAVRMRLDPVEALLGAGMPPDQALHGLLVLRGAARRLEREAEALRAEQAELGGLTHEIAATVPRLREAQADQAAQGAALDRALADARERRAKRDAADAAALAARRAAEQAAERAKEAATVGGAVDRLDTARRRDPPTPPTPPAPEGGATRLLVPVAGRVVQGWGDPTEAGPSGGLTYRAPPQARVASPCRGRVAFAGPFRSFGLLLIVDCGRGYDVVMAGFERLDAQVGQAVEMGEPVGVMPSWNPQAPGNRPGLYVELRKDGQRVDPSPFLRTGE